MSFRRDIKIIMLFLLPALLIYSFFSVIPIISSFYYSTVQWSGISGTEVKFVGLENFIELIHYDAFLISIKNILWLLALTVVTQLPFGLMLALILDRKVRGYKFFKAAFFMPQVISVTAISILWGFILMPADGVLNTLLTKIGLEQLTTSWLVSKNTAMTTVTLVNTWIGVGFHMALMLAALSGIPTEIIEVACLDGAKGFRKLFSIILPMIWENIKSSVVIMITGSLKAFEIVFVLTEGGPNGLTHVPTTLLYNEAFRYENYGTGSAIAVFIFILSLLLTLFSMRVMQREKLEY